jgi:hypothetical protein
MKAAVMEDFWSICPPHPVGCRKVSTIKEKEGLSLQEVKASPFLYKSTSLQLPGNNPIKTKELQAEKGVDS